MSTATDTASCACCGLTEECTPEYIARVRERHHGHWICGLCAEAVQDEIARAGLTTEEALQAHASFRSSPPSPVGLVSAVARLLRRCFRSAPPSPSLPRSETCLSPLPS